jgi:hypothetical protein
MEPISFLDGISGFVRTSTNTSADKPIRIAVIDPAYDGFASPYPDGTPAARVTFEGETVLSGKSYAVAGGYIPTPGARVWLVPIGNSYLITGPVTNYSSQGFYANPGGTDIGVEFGDGSYFDATSGLFLLTDADIQGDLTVSGIGAYLHKYRTTVGASVVSSTAFVTDSVLFLDLSIGVWEINLYLTYTTATGDLKTDWQFNGTWAGYKLADGISPYSIGTTTIADANSRLSAPGQKAVHGLTGEVIYGGQDASLSSFLHETATVNVTVAGRWNVRHTQRVSNASQALIREGSRITARRVG